MPIRPVDAFVTPENSEANSRKSKTRLPCQPVAQATRKGQGRKGRALENGMVRNFQRETND